MCQGSVIFQLFASFCIGKLATSNISVLGLISTLVGFETPVASGFPGFLLSRALNRDLRFRYSTIVTFP